ncbi:DUF3870 domain-containing protein [Bacillus sp. ISL-39]|uniref:DUF3870 domain-containing protein n=1 Tax=Bacillus sp. ISL-39 TaxID=2819124 RepID=UPI001BE7BB38|nr:DUF3870 domain-containing protein [Bacillus sp. ISL-39]MBT2639721.1 DUF3870 domain-containing protein [Bacillus sp. ISL-39]
MKSEMKDSYVFVAGFAQLPKGTPVFEERKSIGCLLIIDKDQDLIVDCDFTFIKDITNNFLSSLLRGQSLASGVDHLTNLIESRFLVPPQKAIVQAVISAYNRYIENK